MEWIDIEDDEMISANFNYDEQGNKIKETYADGSYSLFEYDSQDNVISQKTYTADEKLQETLLYEYDINNQIINSKIIKDNKTVCEKKYSYDLRGNVISETASYDGGVSNTASYEYDAQGKLLKVSYPSSSKLGTIEYVYDNAGYIKSILQNGKKIEDYEYDELNQLSKVKHYETPGATAYILKENVYDVLGRISKIKYSKGSSLLESFDYEYDKNNNITSKTRINNLDSGNKINTTTTYTYDDKNQLIKSVKKNNVDGTEKVCQYEYDAVGNRVKEIVDDEETTYDYNGLNQLVKKETPDAEILYSYDEIGNQILEENTTEGTNTKFEYSVRGNMTSVATSNDTINYTEIQSNVYDENGQRMLKIEGARNTYYVYDEGAVIYSTDGKETDVSYIYGEDNVVSSVKNNGKDYYSHFTDLLDSTTSIMKDGTGKNIYDYSDFGDVSLVNSDSAKANAIENEVCYTGAIQDKTTGLQYMNARYYNSSNGRFISQDTYRGEEDDPATWNLYTYCGNNPVTNIDPSGHVFFGYWNKKQHYFAYNQNAPQKYFGYYSVYDFVSNKFGMDIMWRSFPVGNWCIEFWKGEYGKMYGYGISNGCEIGLYHKHQCAYQKSKRLRMRMSLYIGGTKLFTRDSKTSTKQKKAWWLTAFKPSPYLPNKKTVSKGKLRMTGTIWFKSSAKKYRNAMKKLYKGVKSIKRKDSRGGTGTFTAKGHKNKVKTFSWK